MIISVHKVHRIQQIAEEVKRELREQSIAYQDIEQEIMIETPAAAVMSDELSVAPREGACAPGEDLQYFVNADCYASL